MYFISTRGGEKVTGAQAIVQGLAKNGGLFVPETFPKITEAEFEEMKDRVVYRLVNREKNEQLLKEIPKVDAGLAASVFHFGEIAIPDLKKNLKENGVNVRL